jgi:hypothetical protein
MPRKQMRLRDIIDGMVASCAVSTVAAVVVGVYAKPEIRNHVGGLRGALLVGLFIVVTFGLMGAILGRLLGASLFVAAAWLVYGFGLFAGHYGGS